MTRVRFATEYVPTSGNELQRALREALDRTATLDDFAQAVRDQTQFEIRHGIDPASFFARFQSGEMGDEVDLIRWVNMYKFYQEIASFPHHQHWGDTVIASVPPDLSEVLHEIDGIL